MTTGEGLANNAIAPNQNKIRLDATFQSHNIPWPLNFYYFYDGFNAWLNHEILMSFVGLISANSTSRGEVERMAMATFAFLIF